MERKILFGLVVAGIVSAFWACGSGDIIEPEFSDKSLSLSIKNDPSGQIIETYVDNAINKACVGQLDTTACKANLAPNGQANSSASVSSSSKTGFGIYNNKKNSSSSSAPTGISSSSSSSSTQIMPISSSSF